MTPDTPNPVLLQQEIAALREQVQALQEENEQLQQHNQVLRLKVDAMARKLFGKSSEKLDPARLQMVFEALQNEPPDNAPKKPDAFDSAVCDSEADPAATPTPEGTGKRKKRTLEQIIAGLPVSEVIIDPPEVKAEPEAWQCIGAEETRLIDYIPGKFACQKLVRRKYVRKEARHLPPITAALPTLQGRCIATPRLLAHTLTQRFEQHLPSTICKRFCVGVRTRPNSSRLNTNVLLSINVGLLRFPRFTFHPFHTALPVTLTMRTDWAHLLLRKWQSRWQAKVKALWDTSYDSN